MEYWIGRIGTLSFLLSEKRNLSIDRCIQPFPPFALYDGGARFIASAVCGIGGHDGAWPSSGWIHGCDAISRQPSRCSHGNFSIRNHSNIQSRFVVATWSSFLWLRPAGSGRSCGEDGCPWLSRVLTIKPYPVPRRVVSFEFSEDAEREAHHAEKFARKLPTKFPTRFPPELCG